MCSVKENGRYLDLSMVFQYLCLLLGFQFLVAQACKTGLESSCVWIHDPKTNLLWKMRREPESFVELRDCKHPKCGIAIIQSPWLPALDTEVTAKISYKIFGTSQNYIRLNMVSEDSSDPRQLFSANGDYTSAYPETWSSKSVTIPATPTKFQLLLKAEVTYSEAMAAVKDINLNGNVFATISPIPYAPEFNECSTDETGISDKTYPIPYIDQGNNDEEAARFQALETEGYFIDDEDLLKGYTQVVEPRTCMYK